MRALVTGASGFVGSRVVHRCRERGFTTIAAVGPDSSLARLEGVEGVTVVRADLMDADAMRRLALEARPDFAVHAAWRIAPDVHDSPANLACAAGSLALLRGLDESGCRRAVFVGTHLEYAPSEHDVHESSPVAPRNYYATTKDATHAIARGFASARGLGFAWARLFNLYGPREAEWQLVPHIVRSLLARERCELGSGDDVRGFMHVEDAAAALFAIATSDATGAFNVGSNEPTSIRTLATRIAERTGGSECLSFGAVPPGPRAARRVVPDVARLRQELAFVPRYTLDAGLDSVIEYWRSVAPRNENAGTR